ncbi:MAG: D-glycero-beta-D-manno-heptose 1-phosphate adenylyltransferase [Candidatus Limimorpha sp.]|nr:D-glycero-beta-D-manno-heptose 1-phosphate adenylyltransferase [Bacteroidales bacterium]MDY6075063.1 D-glycero-beta-D-manno-heptose 1-phosphate adenylyltransferase [Bacteroidales bacterium]
MNHLEKIQNKILNKDNLAEWVAECRAKGSKIVFSNGCFDILHRGHVEYLAKAANFGDEMLIGLNTDASVKRLKGPSRPINDEYARAIVLAGLEFVSAVVLFDEDTPYNLIKAVQPDVLVKGSDYKPEDIVGYDIVTAKGGRVETIDFVDGYSTTRTIEKSRNA